MPLVAPLDALSSALARRQVGDRRSTRPNRSPLKLIVDAISDSNRRKAEREIARYIALAGTRPRELNFTIDERFGQKR